MRLSELTAALQDYQQAIEEVNRTTHANEEKHAALVDEMRTKLHASMQEMAEYKANSTKIVTEIKESSQAHLHHWRIFFAPAN